MVGWRIALSNGRSIIEQEVQLTRERAQRDRRALRQRHVTVWITIMGQHGQLGDRPAVVSEVRADVRRSGAPAAVQTWGQVAYR